MEDPDCPSGENWTWRNSRTGAIIKGARVSEPPCKGEEACTQLAASVAVLLKKYSGTAGVGVTIRNGTYNLPKRQCVFKERWRCTKPTKLS
jgi:hypothetical protein